MEKRKHHSIMYNPCTTKSTCLNLVHQDEVRITNKHVTSIFIKFFLCLFFFSRRYYLLLRQSVCMKSCCTRSHVHVVGAHQHCSRDILHYLHVVLQRTSQSASFCAQSTCSARLLLCNASCRLPHVLIENNSPYAQQCRLQAYKQQTAPDTTYTRMIEKRQVPYLNLIHCQTEEFS